MDEATKFPYLPEYLDDPAKDAVGSYPSAPQGYESVIEKIRERFGNPGRITSLHLPVVQRRGYVRALNCVRCITVR